MASAAITTSSSEPRTLYWPLGLRETLGLGDINKTLSNFPQTATHIKFHPDSADYETRRTTRICQGGLKQDVPAGWPTTVSGPLVWEGSNFHSDAEFVYHLSKSDKNEIRCALKQVKEHDLSFDNIKEDTFPLPGLRCRLEEAREKIYNGLGFIVLRGLDVDEYSSRESLIIFLGVSSYLAAHKGAQDQAGNLLRQFITFQTLKKHASLNSKITDHIVDYDRVDSDVDLPIHTDITADIVATLPLKSSKSGGEAIVASAWTVYNELATTRPDLIHVLAEPDWPFDTYGRDPEYYNRALLFYHNEQILINFSRRVLTGHPISPRTQGIPGLTEAQAEALDAVHFIAQKHKLTFSTEKGDMRFINNYAILHGREAYSDDDIRINLDKAERRSQRHLLRLWLHNEKMAWKLPPSLRLVWARTFDEKRHRTWDAAQYMSQERVSSRGRSPSPSPPPPPRPGPRSPIPYPCD
ncbi:hypothetical protein BGW36DRAFT_460448 [Talaromyces proteolyticus]|uniref:TauD/TfdA-like domain-containing protein n=1 Tax=Talaromyces proteolyticus TaxID=1131652 RepID=A0AAD4Q1J6_9EURO|nr:uncharacterized protein BGW36DRAFT_460448 [Talaromyces proteolyticus]KAH8698550.1 hypothetical protein BGW36DRAFT_460448 [Talaromyces proteolyticus]